MQYLNCDKSNLGKFAEVVQGGKVCFGSISFVNELKGKIVPMRELCVKTICNQS